MPARRLRALAVASCLVGSTGIIGFATADPTPKAAEGEAANAGDQAFLAAMREMMAEMHRNLPTGDVDQDFVRLSVTQRQGAVAMAKAELKYGKDERLKALAKEIVTSQEKEIALMKAWEDKRRGGH